MISMATPPESDPPRPAGPTQRSKQRSGQVTSLPLAMSGFLGRPVRPSPLPSLTHGHPPSPRHISYPVRGRPSLHPPLPSRLRSGPRRVGVSQPQPIRGATPRSSGISWPAPCPYRQGTSFAIRHGITTSPGPVSTLLQRASQRYVPEERNQVQLFEFLLE